MVIVVVRGMASVGVSVRDTHHIIWLKIGSYTMSFGKTELACGPTFMVGAVFGSRVEHSDRLHPDTCRAISERFQYTINRDTGK